jgi:hypothetical protein
MDGAQAQAKALQHAALAKYHKKNVEYHRRQAANEQRALQHFLEKCEEAGISVIIDGEQVTKLTNALIGGTSGDSSREEEVPSAAGR